jgi:predicted amidohydrolase YtcJ
MSRFFVSKTTQACLILLVTVTALCGSPLLAQQPADLILHNGKILTVDKNFAIAQAVAVTGNKITAVGSDDQVLATAGPKTQKIDLKGRTVVPGLIDTHRHMYSAAEITYGGLVSEDGLRRYSVDWRGVKSKDDVLNQIKGLMDKYKFKPGQWIYFNNLIMFIGPGGTEAQAKILYDDLNQWELDKVTPNNPVLLSMGVPDFNGFLLNKKAMDFVMGKYGDFVKKNGRFWVDAQGRPEGHLEPPASRLVLPFTYDRDPATLAIMYKKDMDEAAPMGLTTVTTRMPKDSVDAYKLLESRGELTFRIAYGLIEPFGTVTDLQTGLKPYDKVIGTGSDKIWVSGMGPTAVDGSTSRACTDQKRSGTYSAIDSWFPMGQCHMDMEYRGSPKKAAPLQDNYFRNWVTASAREGIRFANVHVAGDRAVGTLLNAVEAVQKQFGPQSTKNWAFDHCDMVNPKDFQRLARAGITMSCYVMVSVNGSAAIAQAYGDKVANTFPSPLKSMLDAGVKVVLESDSNSFLWDDIKTAITRKDRNGKVWAPQERVDRPTALRMLTSWASEYVLRPDQLGTIEPGKLADLVVLDRDYLTIPEDEIGKIQPQVTVFDGKIIYVHPEFAQEYNLRPPGALVATYKELTQRRKLAQMIPGMEAFFAPPQ